MWSLWTAKSGVGCTALAVGVAATLRRHEAGGVLVVDLGGDLGVAVGAAEPPAGLTDWLASDSSVDALVRLEAGLSSGVSLLSRGAATSWPESRDQLLIGALERDPRAVVVDVGLVSPRSLDAMARLRSRFAALPSALMVSRACYLGLRRALELPDRPQAIVLVREQGRSIDAHECASILGAPVVAQIDHDPAVARSLDRGRLLTRPPRSFVRQVRGALR